MSPEAVLRTFAELAKTGPTAPTNVLRQRRDFEWLQYKSRRVFEGKRTSAIGLVGAMRSTYTGPTTTERRIERLLAAGALHQTERLLRIGWIWLAGTVEHEGKPVRYCLPVLSIPVAKAALSPAAVGLQIANLVSVGVGDERWVLEPVGDPEITPLIEDETARERLLRTVDFAEDFLTDNLSDLGDTYVGPHSDALTRSPELRTWVEDAAEAIGVAIDEWHYPRGGRPPDRSTVDGVAAFVGVGMYVDQAPTTDTHRGSLLSLALMKNLEESVFGKLYGAAELADREHRRAVQVRPLSARQAGIAGHAGSADLAVVSGAPGTGKTHLLTVVALDAVARGESVLVVGSSPYSVDVLLDHFGTMRGPTPVAFGSSRHHARLAQELSELFVGTAASPDAEARVRQHNERRTSVERMLRAEMDARRQDVDPSYRIDRTAELDRAGDLDELAALLDRYENPRPFDFRRRRRRKQLEQRLGVHTDPERRDPTALVDEMRQRLDGLLVGRDAQRLLAADGLVLDGGLADLATLDERAAAARAELIGHNWMSQLSPADRRTLATVAHAMNVSRSQRRVLLSDVKAADLTRAAPLWVGTAADVNDVLPRTSGMFDLVILDEASQMTQPHAAAALVRAKRAIVCGDPEQLGHVSFVSEEQVRDAAAMFGTDPSIVDTRRNSIFDVASAQVPVLLLDEHFRSAPHLIEFSARRFYHGALRAATRHPSNEAADHIHVEIVADGRRTGPDSKRVNKAEIARCLEVAERYIADGCRSIGFLSPFRAQADALEEAILDVYRLEEVEKYGLRVGTVHGFQGDERDVMIVSWAVGPDESSGSWRFVNQSTLFNVMVTRARDEVVIVTSDPDPPGLAGEYLRWAEPLEDLVADAPPTDAWVSQIAAALTEHGVAFRSGYRVGRHVIDLVAGEGPAAVAIDCLPHPDGPEAHLDRALLLRRAGWRTADAFETRWRHRTGEFAIELLSRYPDLRPEGAMA